MKNIFLSIALATTIYASAQKVYDNNVSIESRPVNRASEWSKESALEARKIDSSKLVKKTITQEISLPKALDVLIDMSGELVINTWNENKIKMETMVQFEAPNELTDSQWLERLGVNLKVFGSTVRVKTRSGNGITFFSDGSASTLTKAQSAFVYTNGTFYNTQKGGSPVTLYIPAESIMEIENKYGHLKISNNIKSLLLDNTAGEVEFANIGKLQIRSNRGSFSGGVVTDADIELSHGRLSLKQVDKGLVATNYSTIEIESLKDVKLTSSNDEIDIDNASTLSGIKNYGNLRINQLTGKLDLEGMNSDIKLRHIASSAQLIKIVNRNADLRLPANELSNFSVDVKGSYNTVYSSFSEKTTIDTLTAAEIESVKAITSAVPTTGQFAGVKGTTFSNFNNSGSVMVNSIPINLTTQGNSIKGRNPFLKYAAKIGSGSDQLKYQIVCTSCVLDFK